MQIEKREKEIEKRERLVQTYLIIGGFLLAYAKDEIRQEMISIFSGFLLFIILYYIYVSRTKNCTMIDVLGLVSSYSYSLLILVFMNSQASLNIVRFLNLFIALTAILAFSLLSPESSDTIINKFRKFVAKQEQSRPKLARAISYALIIIAFILSIYNLYISNLIKF